MDTEQRTGIEADNNRGGEAFVRPEIIGEPNSNSSKTRGKTKRDGENREERAYNNDRKVIEIPIENEETRGVKKGTKRGNYGGKKAEPKQAQNEEDLYMQVSMLLLAFSNFAVLKFGEHWRITEGELKTIVDPLGKILNKTSLGQKISEQSVYISLSVALGMVLIPRILTQMSLNKSKKINKGVVKNEIDEKRKIKETNNTNDERVRENSTDNINSLEHIGTTKYRELFTEIG